MIIVATNQISKISKDYGFQPILKNVMIEVHSHDRIGIVGLNGSGKITLFKMLLNEIEPDEGMIRLGSSVKVGYLSQQALEGDSNRTVLDVFREVVSLPEGEARAKQIE